jgi:hypothetical protein
MGSRVVFVISALCLILLVASGPASAKSPKTVTFTATCGGQSVSGSTIINSSPVLTLDGQQAIIKYEVALNIVTGRTFTYSVPGFTMNSLPTTTCVFSVPYLPDYVFTTQVYFTPATP